MAKTGRGAGAAKLRTEAVNVKTEMDAERRNGSARGKSSEGQNPMSDTGMK
jgi:hypothetical protein